MCGKPKLLSNEELKFVRGVLAWQDPINDSYSIKEATDLIMTLKPEVNREAAQTQLTRRVIPDNHAAGNLKKKTVKVQATTRDQMIINAAQQWC
jgi:hypothetical protein